MDESKFDFLMLHNQVSLPKDLPTHITDQEVGRLIRELIESVESRGFVAKTPVYYSFEETFPGIVEHRVTMNAKKES